MRLFTLINCLWLVSCFPSAKSSQSLNVTGSSTVAPLVAEIAKRFEERYPDYKINVQTGGSSRGISDAMKGTADIGMVSRALHQQEQALKHYTIASDGIGLIAHRDINIEDLSHNQVLAIFQGKVKNWLPITGQNQAITVVHKAQGRSTSELFIKHFKLKYQDVDAQIIIGDNEQGIKNVSSIPGAIGYVSIGAAEHAAKQGRAIRLVKLEGLQPSTKAVASGNYPILRPLNLVIKDQSNPDALKFIKFARSQEVFDIVRKLDFVPPKI
ncbi:phosphate ABC transporter substrate-binding protein [Pseudobacteriovorax antillogorgiicola]|uniref:Phosphate ABC transporter substrate-binding protein, PhoT family n=1 Tax=Pseudobacteriovorax antillogorgiicola TaxID=1513793 RepID=A0A1Y6CJF1_9BACT|nr:phosphate ABC transporter substrate-binding protein [Pseudobacteriovorax antillogorgiicola]TCS46700.1 phosphate ABC transporter substrate-binding protein (PhoT family) [Pseudobacteriovorax antillogorgiicola]SMF66882.1 phosphate ABC transporter substrate-binding protein, PhoT family [Pseudobacteriovorax antillogorgiicola]